MRGGASGEKSSLGQSLESADFEWLCPQPDAGQTSPLTYLSGTSKPVATLQGVTQRGGAK